MHKILVTIHIWSSILFTFVALVLCTWIVIGLVFKKDYHKIHNYLEVTYIALLYLGLFLGFILYFIVDPVADLSKIPIQELVNRQNSKFWAIEHFSVMLFTLLIVQIGKYFTSKALSSRDKFKYALFYYGSATSIIMISMFFYMLSKI